MFENCLIQGILIDSHVKSPLGSQLKILITLHKFSKKFEMVSGRAYWDQKFFDEKQTDKKSRDTVSLNCVPELKHVWVRI